MPDDQRAALPASPSGSGMMARGPNRSTAVRERRVEAPDALDDFPTPPWATRALVRELIAEGEDPHAMHACDPACNRGFMARPMGEYFAKVSATDVFDYGVYEGNGQHVPWRMDGVSDFLVDWTAGDTQVDWIITNPPFRLGAEFVNHALTCARRGVAVLVRVAFSEGVGRYEKLFRDRPETLFLPFVERVVMWKGVCLDPDVKIWDAKRQVMTRPTTATAYGWMVWKTDCLGAGKRKRLIPPCRRALTHPGDYPPVPDHLRPPMGALAFDRPAPAGDRPQSPGRQGGLL